MAVAKAVDALRKMREFVALDTEDDLHVAASWALVYLAEHTASEVGAKLREMGIMSSRVSSEQT